MNQWMKRKVTESLIIGGDEKWIYEVTPQIEIEENTAYKPTVSHWANSSVYARVSGINKASVTVFPELRDGSIPQDFCARLETRVETVKVFGIINISVLATGTIYLGQTIEPIKDANDPMQKISMGIPYTLRPKALKFDYKVTPKGPRVYIPGFGRQKTIEGQNAAEVMIILQQRNEDENGNIYAKRVGTGYVRFDKEQNEWQNDFKIELQYGNITHLPNYKDYMSLFTKERTIFSLNSKGENVPIKETGWADANTTPTHMIIRFSSGYGGAYIGSIGSKFWIDNVALVF